MTAIFVPGTAPSYQILSTDIIGNKVAGVSYIGAICFATDSGKMYRVLDDLTLAPFAYQTTSASGTANIGMVTLNSGSSMIGVVTLNSGSSYAGQIGGVGYLATGSFAGPNAATTYNANTGILSSGCIPIEIPNALRVAGGTAYITDIGLSTSASGITITPRIHFYSASTVTVGSSSGSFPELYADMASMYGYYTMPAMSGASGSATNCSRSITMDASNATQPRILVQGVANSTSIWYALETRTAFVSAGSQLWSVKVRMDQN